MLRKYSMGIVAACLALPASAQTLDEVIAKSIQARGGLEKIHSVQSARMTGVMTLEPGPMEASFVLELKRPNKMRVDFTFQGMTGVQAFDGTTGWMLMPFMGKTDPEPMPAEQARDAAEDADLDGPLVDYKAKGNTVELLGKEKVEGTDAYKLKVTLKGGAVRTIFIDAATFLEIRNEGRRNVQGMEMDTESTIGDYKEVGGVMLPHSLDQGAKGMPMRQKMTLTKIELNVPIDDSRFTMPAVKKPEPSTSPKS
jgi:outer membrane lipoprotein-sorting protein